jgi:hypothetical protein
MNDEEEEEGGGWTVSDVRALRAMEEEEDDGDDDEERRWVDSDVRQMPHSPTALRCEAVSLPLRGSGGDCCATSTACIVVDNWPNFSQSQWMHARTHTRTRHTNSPYVLLTRNGQLVTHHTTHSMAHCIDP